MPGDPVSRVAPECGAGAPARVSECLSATGFSTILAARRLTHSAGSETRHHTGKS